MDKDNRLELTGFVSRPDRSAQRSERSRRLYMSRMTPKTPVQQKSGGALYLFIRLGVCVLLLIGVVALKLSNSEKGASALAVISSALGDDIEQQPEEQQRLGRLRFVKIPSIIEVFAPGAGPSLPSDARDIAALEEGTVLKASVSSGEDVTSPCPGVVRMTGSDPVYGAFVCISTEDDTDVYVMGLESTTVEQGQPVTRAAILGSAGGEGTLYFKALHSGRPLDAAEFFGTGSMQ